MNGTSLPYAYGAPPCGGRIRAQPEDFFVDEVLGFEPQGAGEHVWLHVRKRNANTEWLMRQIARVAGVKARDVSYAGLKDRAAVTRQWFSVHLPKGDAPQWSKLENEDVRVERVVRHGRKLRRGTLTGNRFTIVVRALAGEANAVEERLRAIAAGGVPNYFGEQRFGHDNLAKAEAMIAGDMEVRDRFERGIYLSSLRSALFNEVLARRVLARTWNVSLPGECLMLDGTHSYFVAEAVDETISRRVSEGDVHPSGPLWGQGDLPSRGGVRELEAECADARCTWTQFLQAEGLTQERRALRVRFPLAWSRDADTLTLQFELPAGAYATSVLREVVQYDSKLSS